jgi:site-specific DNA-methyltransferase (adenine-specific)
MRRAAQVKVNKLHDGLYTRRQNMQVGRGEDREAIWGIKKNIGLRDKSLCGVPWRVALALQADGWLLRQDIIWEKPNPMPERCSDRCTKAHEYVFLLAKNGRYFFDQLKEPAVSKGKYATRNKRSVWAVSPVKGEGAHFAVFPPDLIEPMIRAGCPEGGAVLDPFAGTGTVGLVAQRLGRRAILIELNPEYAQIAVKRIKAV